MIFKLYDGDELIYQKHFEFVSSDEYNSAIVLMNAGNQEAVVFWNSDTEAVVLSDNEGNIEGSSWCILND